MDLLTGNLKSIYRKYLLSAIGSAIISTIYISVDLIAVGHYAGPTGSAAFSCVNPLYSAMIALGLLLGIGGSVWMSNCRGAGREREANGYFTVTAIAAVIAAAVLCAVYLIWLDPLLRLFGADDVLLPHARAYARWIAIASPAFLLGVALGSFVRNDGAPGLCAVSTLIGGGLNMIGDYVLVFVCDMGMAGAGLATAIGQMTMLLVLLTHFLRRGRCRMRLVRPEGVGKKLRGIVSAGFSPFVVDLTNGVTIALFNNQIMRLATSVELAVFGTVSNVIILFQSLFYGVGQCIQPTVSVCHGAGKESRVRFMRRAALYTAVAMGAAFCLACEVFPEFFLRLYMDVTDEVLAVGPRILRVYATSLLFMGVGIVGIYYLQSILRSRQSVALSLLRGFVLCVAFMLVLPAVFGFDAIWLTMPLTELITAVIAVALMKKSAGKA